mgnify:FL=1
MAKYEKHLTGNFDELLELVTDGVLNGSMSASYENGSDWANGTVRCAVRVFERYSYMGGNRVSMNVTLVGNDRDLFSPPSLRAAVRPCSSSSTPSARRAFWKSWYRLWRTIKRE